MGAHPIPDPIELAAELIRCPSITPQEGGALDLLQHHLQALGLTCHRLPFADVDNLYARIGTAAPHFCFAGHTDVVPVGNRAAWASDPFAGEVRDGALWGRGASDMKGAIAAFIAAMGQHLTTHAPLNGSISLLITGDEEGDAINGTRKMLDWLQSRGEIIDDCLVGEPTNPETLGEMVKIGRRGSVNFTLRVRGTQGHVAYPHLAHNPIPALAAIITQLTTTPLDDGTEHFQPSHLEATNLHIGNDATNVIPAEAVARFNIRYNTHWTPDSIEAWVRDQIATAAAQADYDIEFTHSGDCFLTAPNDFVQQLSTAIYTATGQTPTLSTSGGTSDARFIKNITRVVEFGLISKTMHKIDEHAALDDIRQLTEIYRTLLANYFA